MTKDSHDPRIGKILHLISQLTDDNGIANDVIYNTIGDDIDAIIAGLTIIAGQTEQRQRSQEQITAQLTDVLETIDKIVSPDFTSNIQSRVVDDLFAAIAVGLNTISDKLQASTVSINYLNGILHSIVDNLIITGADGDIKLVSESTCQLLGYEPHELLGQSVNSLFTEQSNERNLKERTIVAKDGRQLSVFYSASELRDEKGQPDGWMCFMQDCTERKEKEQALQMFQTSVDQATDAIFWMTRDAGFLYVNEQACHSLGYSREELLQLQLWDIDPAISRERWNSRWQQDMNQPLDALETFHRRKDGSIFPVEVSSKHLRFGEKELSVAVVRDVTERKSAENELRRSEAYYRALIESQVDLISRYRPDTTLTFVNDAYCRFYGKAREELIGQSYLTMVAPEFHQLTIKEAENMVKDPRPISGEYLNFAADGRACWIQWVIQGIVDENNQVTEIQAVGRDITRLKQTEVALRDSEFFLQKSQTVGQTGSYYLDVSTGQWISSPMLDEIFGIDDHFTKNVEGWISLVHPEHKAEMLNHLQQHVLGKRNRFDKEYRILRLDNQQERWVHGLGELEFDAQGKPLRMIGTIQDITDRRQMERDLLLTQFCVDHASVGIMRTGSDAQILSVNQKYCQMLGYTAQELCTLHVYDIDSNFPLERWQQHRSHIRSHGSDVFETVHRRKDGTTFPVEISATYVSFQGDEFSFTFIRDITERRQMLEALRLNSFAVERVSDAVYWINADGIITDVNEAACHMLGYSYEEFIGMPVDAIDPINTLDEVKEIWQFIKKEKTHTFETQHKSKDGRFLSVEVMVNYIAFEGKELNCAFVRDITERKQAADALFQSQQMLQLILDHIPSAVLWKDRNSVILGCNRQEAIVAGLQSTQDIIGLTDYDIPNASPESAALFREADQRVMNSDTPELNYEELSLSLGRPPRWLRTSKVPLHDAAGQVIGILVVLDDITERKQAEAALQLSEERLRLSASVISIGIFDHDHHTNALYWSPELRAIYGVGSDEPVSVEHGRASVYPEDVERIDRAVQRAWDPAGDGRFDVEYRIIDRSGMIRWISIRSRTLFEGEGDTRHPVRTIGAVMDLTERKQAEINLQVSEERLRQAVRAGSIGILDHDHRTNAFYWSPELRAIYGFDVNEPVFIEHGRDHIHPEDLECIDMAAQRAWDPAGDGRFDIEHRIIDRSGMIHWLTVRSQTLFEGEGDARRPVRTIGAVMDLTERKQAEIDLRASEERLRIVMENLPIMVDAIGEDSNFVVWNKECERVTGYRADEIIGNPEALQLLYPVQTQHNQMIASFAELGGEFRNQEWALTSKDGVEKIISWSNVSEQFPVPGWQTWAVGVDVTERRRAEEAVQKLNDELEQRVIERTQELEEANKEIRHFAYIVSHDLRAPLVNLKGFSGELRSALKVVKDGCDDVMELLIPARQAMMRQAIDEDIPEALQFIESSVDNMDSFTKAILKLSRLGRLQLELVEVNTKTIVENILKTLAYQIDQQRVNLIVGDLPVIVADVVAMEQIFANILSNAVGYLVSDRPGEIEIRAESTANEIIFRIRDNGRGIAKEDMGKVFAPFRRAGKQDVPGEGMGLAYVQTLIRRHGGRIWCDSEAGVGTTFTFTIPKHLTNDSAWS